MTEEWLIYFRFPGTKCSDYRCKRFKKLDLCLTIANTFHPPYEYYVQRGVQELGRWHYETVLHGYAP